jgi:hypothetical protein
MIAEVPRRDVQESERLAPESLRSGNPGPRARATYVSRSVRSILRSFHLE